MKGESEREKAMKKRRIVLVTLPFQGHITPMMQLGKALQFKGFSITVALGELNRVCSSQNFPGFQFVTIPECLPMSLLGTQFAPAEFFLKLNQTNEEGFKDCIAQLLLQQGNNIACIIYDELLYFSGVVAKEFKLPCVVFSTTCASIHVSRCVLRELDVNKFLVDMKDPGMEEKVVENLHPLRYRDLLPSELGPTEPLLKFRRELVNKTRASAVISNTATCLEWSSLSWLQQELGMPVYPLGPLHITASANSTLLEEDRSCLEWLNKQRPSSVIYISMGSVYQMETKEALEMAWGLCDSNQPFLWVIRPGCITGSEWIESLPDEISKMVSEKGYIVKWAPQNQVLGHSAVGGFWSHCGWNSTLESVAEGVPIICRPFTNEQDLNARYIQSVWSVGIQLQGKLERRGVERAVKRLMVDEEGAGMRKRALDLKEKLKASVEIGGSSYNALDDLVKYLETK